MESLKFTMVANTSTVIELGRYYRMVLQFFYLTFPRNHGDKENRPSQSLEETSSSRVNIPALGCYDDPNSKNREG